MVVSFLLVEAIKQRLDVHPSGIQLLGQVLKNEWKSARQREKLSKWYQSWRCDVSMCSEKGESRAGVQDAQTGVGGQLFMILIQTFTNGSHTVYWAHSLTDC